MTGFTDGEWEPIVSTCAGNALALAESLRFCFDEPFTVAVGQTLPWAPSVMPPEFAGRGLVLAFKAEGRVFLVLVPESLPIPPWAQAPGLSQSARLQTLAQEWSVNLFPPDRPVSLALARWSLSLADSIRQAGPIDGARALPLTLTGSSPGAAPVVSLLIGPVALVPSDDIRRGRSPSPQTDAERLSGSSPAATNSAASGTVRLERLRKVPVTISVRLAEKKIEMGQLLALTPGGLITFNKSCEDLLDLYVNNRLYCRGEAVKVGEKFGLKINELPAIVRQE